MAKNISIDRTKRLREEPHTGHNRWHPDIPPVIEVAPGEEVTLETRDAVDLQIGPRTTVKDLEKMERTVAHPLTGPVYVKGAKPGDLLEIEYLDIVPERYGWTRFSPGFGFLPDLFDRYMQLRQQNNPTTGAPYTAGEALQALNCGQWCAPAAITTYPFDTDRTARSAAQPPAGS